MQQLSMIELIKQIRSEYNIGLLEAKELFDRNLKDTVRAYNNGLDNIKADVMNMNADGFENLRLKRRLIHLAQVNDELEEDLNHFKRKALDLQIKLNEIELRDKAGI